MKQINIREIIYNKNPDFLKSIPAILRDLVFRVIERSLCLKKINRIIESHIEKKNFDFIDGVLEELDISFNVSGKDRDKIPSEGKLICIANHPLGGLDGLILVKLISEVRPDVKIVVNDILKNIDNLTELFLPIDITNNKNLKNDLTAIDNALLKEQAVIFFPAGEVSRLHLNGIKDSKWFSGIVHFAGRHKTPVLPVYINARNSIIFYLVSIINKKLSAYLLPSELFNKSGKTISVKIGHTISSEVFSNKLYRNDVLLKLLRKHLVKISQNKKGVFKTEKNIVRPVERKLIRKQLNESKQIGETNDGKKIFLVNYDGSEEIVKEIARLREVTFRKVGEGTGLKLDIDRYDKTYKHLVLWDDAELEIVGAYRFGIAESILKNSGTEGFYTKTLFNYSKDFEKLLPQSIELGRSFIQAKYWNSNALDYLWQGIGTFLWLNPEVKYLFGGVSLSNSYSEDAKDLIIYFYDKWFGAKEKIVEAKQPFRITSKKEKEFELKFSTADYNSEFKQLKSALKIYGYSVPVLYKQYAELCEQGGTCFLDFGIDKDFNNCVDSFILVDVNKIKDEKKQRYIYRNTVHEKLLFPAMI